MGDIKDVLEEHYSTNVIIEKQPLSINEFSLSLPSNYHPLT